MFSSDSRWDRHTPDQDHNEEPIEVGAIFKKGELTPTCFVYRSRKYPVKEITYRWKEKRGRDVLHYFTVSDGATLYRIFLNDKNMAWRLDRSEPL